jgi:hypothetical protein
MEEVSTTAGEAANGVKRKLVEVEDYDWFRIDIRDSIKRTVRMAFYTNRK